MKIIDYEIIIPRGKTYTEIAIIGDVHRGNEFFDEELWNQYYEDYGSHKGFKNNKNIYILTIGDLMETAMQNSLGVQDQSEWIEDQYLWTKEWLSEINDDCRLIGLVEGNHERRATRNWFRTTRLLAKELDVPYAHGVIVVNITLRKGDKVRKYKICAAHGKGNPRTIGGKMNAVLKLKDIVADADVYVIGHLHDKFAKPVPIFFEGKLVERLFGMTGAYLSYGGYAEDALYPPPARGSLKIKLHFDIRRVSGR